MGIVALYQGFGSSEIPCMYTSARLKNIENMTPNCGDYFVLHSWRDEGDTGDDHCIVVYEWYGKLIVSFYSGWLGGHFMGFDFPLDHEIWIGLRPNHEVGSREYNSFTWWIRDKTADTYIEETRVTPETWITKGMDVALEAGDENTPNGLRRSMAEIVCLDQNNAEVYLPDVFGWCEWSHPIITNHREEIYSNNGYEVECIQWKTIEGLEDMVLNINSDPQEQDVLIDGENVGITPLSKTVTCADHDIMVQPREEEEDMVLNINSDPQGQEVVIDGEMVGLTPVSETVTCQEHNIMVQPQGVSEYPDLIIEDVWNVGNEIKYRIKNIGNCTAGSSHTKLKVDGVAKETKSEGELSAGQSREASFSHYWECSGTEDTIEVVADCNGEVTEGNEGNNNMQKTFECSSGCVGIDLTPIEIFTGYGRIYFKVKNQGTISSISCYHYIYFWTGSTWQYQGRTRTGAQAPDTTITSSSSVYWPSAGTKIKVRVNGSNSFTDCNPDNNEMIVTA